MMVDVVAIKDGIEAYEYEFAQIYPPGGYNEEKIEYSGETSKRMRFKVNDNFTEENTLRIIFNRYFKQIDELNKKQMTGMSLEWFIENENGEKVYAEEKELYLNDNKLFIKTVNMLHSATNSGNISEEKIWKIAKNARKEFVYESQYEGYYGGNGIMDENDINRLLEIIKNSLSISYPVPETPIHATKISS